MKGLILTNPFDGSVNTHKKALRMAQELNKLGVQTVQQTNDGFLAYINDKGNITAHCTNFDFVLFFDKDKYIAQMLEKAGLRLFNRAESIRLCDDKMLTHIALSQGGVAMPTTLSGALCYTPNALLPDSYLQQAVDTLGLPLVVKECYGSYGEQVYLVQDFNQLKQLTQRLKCTAYLFQQYITESSGHDMRLIVVGGKAVAAMERFSDGDFRSNIELGGKAYAVTPPKEFVDIAEKAAKLLQLDYCGVDVLFGKNGPLLCEVNSNAMFASIERVTGINVAQVYSQHIVNTLNKKLQQ